MKKMLVDHVRIYTDGAFQEGRVLVSDGKFQKIGGASPEPEKQEEECEVLDGKGMCMVPGFIDIHTHGAVGVDVSRKRGFAEGVSLLCHPGGNGLECQHCDRQ